MPFTITLWKHRKFSGCLFYKKIENFLSCSWSPLNLFGLEEGRGVEGQGQKVPALTLNVNNFFIIEANTTRLSDFF